MSFSDNVHVITGGVTDVNIKIKRKELQTYNIRLNETKNIMAKILRYISLQIQVSLILIKLSKNFDCTLFFMQSGAFLPALTAKLFRKKILLVLPSSIEQMARCNYDFFDKFLICLQSVSYELVDRIIIYSSNLVNEWNLRKYEHKIVVGHEHFVDFNRFMVQKKISERSNVVGYIGRFSGEKGILELVKTIPIVKHRKDIYFMLCGEGKLFSEIRNNIRHNCLEAHVKLTEWISHDKVTKFLNDIKLLVLPSYTEGLPNIILEAMSCGTPVLATRVGAIADLIRDGETGFLLESNDPKHIAEKIIELVDTPKLLEKVSKNAYEWVRKNFSEEKTLQSWRKIIQELET
ncbi:MAG: glycosyltransferase family 4 protein [Candidatus Bathyarchaeota archaeon]|nr:glycosyltransferase family 4 protein [Candidatus Bathyarchaeum tardum]